MIPWFFVTDRVNYSRYAPCYWMEMMRLEQTNPYVAHNISNNWTVQRQDRYSFSGVACDQTIEQTLNRDSKLKGGLVGITLNKGAVHRWLMGQAERSAITRQCETMASVAEIDRSRKDLDKSRIEGEEKAVRDVIDVIKSMVNPFDNDHESLVHIASGVVASSDIEDDMKHMVDKGKTAFTSFFENNIIGEKPNIYSTIKKTNLKTFSCLGKKVTSKNSKGQLQGVVCEAALDSKKSKSSVGRCLHVFFKTISLLHCNQRRGSCENIKVKTGSCN
ncbi:uncharacterized protein LOC114541751 [Dendronephthya gigantea]|uniref:uncharacterized protein LOC114541751 n=1 Tax=Dendronephthya gigantea TaxID=151771 RepID=UPI00106A33E3|nr:uncharacterized protein LOC114541750 isoform X2 [Dendronephthya gigantea]XP_028417358.1 uncharacterized protein LOC114541751 [Dendronephthya gigantea]